MNFSNVFLVRRYHEQFSSFKSPYRQHSRIFTVIYFWILEEKKNVAQPRSSTKLGKCSFHVTPTRLYFARAVSLFCSLTVLFGDVLHDVAVVVFLNSLMKRRQTTINHKAFIGLRKTAIRSLPMAFFRKMKVRINRCDAALTFNTRYPRTKAQAAGPPLWIWT